MINHVLIKAYLELLKLRSSEDISKENFTILTAASDEISKNFTWVEQNYIRGILSSGDEK